MLEIYEQNAVSTVQKGAKGQMQSATNISCLSHPSFSATNVNAALSQLRNSLSALIPLGSLSEVELIEDFVGASSANEEILRSKLNEIITLFG